MLNQYIRSEMLLGEGSTAQLKQKRVAVFGVGGVGGHAAEALGRSGVGTIDLFDNDTVSVTNINRQAVALHSTVGRLKVDVMRDRLLDIDPEIKVNTYPIFYLPETADQVDLSVYDYIVDCIDTVSAKIDLAVRASQLGVPIVCAMGAGNKLNPMAFEVTDIYKTSVCPLARVMRRELKARGVKKCKVVYSREEARTPLDLEGGKQEGRRATPGSLPFVPAAAGLLLASTVVYDLLNIK
ncbi:MAG: tRNA threonylcarbamoyladenosine dehydratase [Oscillospiraceae bacterium]|nr:tRNA threonylcarbamoyladenosine dehydratase [Oscillospiraceae bacterium]